jgi:hypothetical protein
VGTAKLKMSYVQYLGVERSPQIRPQSGRGSGKSGNIKKLIAVVAGVAEVDGS